MISLTETSTARLLFLCREEHASAIAIQVYEDKLRFRLREALVDDFVVTLDDRHSLLVDYISMIILKGALLDFNIEKSNQRWVLECPGGVYYG